MEQTENQRVRITKRLLLEALLSLLEKKHISQVSVTELCAKAGINRATFYKHYGTPNDILSEMSHRYTQEMLHFQENSSGKSIAQLIEENCVFMYENRQSIRILIKNSMEREMAAQVLMKLFENAPSPPLLDMSGFDEQERRLTVAYIANGCYSLLEKWIMEDVQKTPHEIAQLLYRICTGGWLNEHEK